MTLAVATSPALPGGSFQMPYHLAPFRTAGLSGDLETHAISQSLFRRSHSESNGISGDADVLCRNVQSPILKPESGICSQCLSTNENIRIVTENMDENLVQKSMPVQKYPDLVECTTRAAASQLKRRCEVTWSETSQLEAFPACGHCMGGENGLIMGFCYFGQVRLRLDFTARV